MDQNYDDGSWELKLEHPDGDQRDRNFFRVFQNPFLTDAVSTLCTAQAVIGVNTHHHPVRQNFTISHELGHFLLHDQEQLHVDHEFRVRLRSEVSGQGTDEAEREANFFAASLLMPKDFLEADLATEDYVDLLDDEFLRSLSRKYNVSTQALVNRLKNLGYIQE